MGSKRNQILASAEHEFLLKGYDRTSMDSILREVGGSKSTIYSHFSDKSVLFAEALAKAAKDLNFSLPRFRLEDPASLEEGLVLLGVELLTVLYRERAVHLFRLVLAESRRFPEVARQFWEEGPAESLREISRFLQEVRPDWSHEETDALASRYFALLRGDFHLRYLLGLEEHPSPRAIVAMAESAVAHLDLPRG